MEQYQLDLEIIKDFLQENKDRYNEISNTDFDRFELHIYEDEEDDVMVYILEGVSIDNNGEIDYLKQLDLDSRAFCMIICKLIWGDKKFDRESGDWDDCSDPYECCMHYQGRLWWPIKYTQWSTLTNESLAHEAALAILALKK